MTTLLDTMKDEIQKGLEPPRCVLKRFSDRFGVVFQIATNRRNDKYVSHVQWGDIAYEGEGLTSTLAEDQACNNIFIHLMNCEENYKSYEEEEQLIQKRSSVPDETNPFQVITKKSDYQPINREEPKVTNGFHLFICANSEVCFTEVFDQARESKKQVMIIGEDKHKISIWNSQIFILETKKRDTEKMIFLYNGYRSSKDIEWIKYNKEKTAIFMHVVPKKVTNELLLLAKTINKMPQ